MSLVSNQILMMVKNKCLMDVQSKPFSMPQWRGRLVPNRTRNTMAQVAREGKWRS
jgi:hypothetical protein